MSMSYFPLTWGKPTATNESNWLISPDASSSSGSAHGNVGVAPASVPMSHTQSPIVTGTSVIAIKYKDGIMMATDCLASYGSLARFRDVQRMTKVGEFTVVGASGEVSDYQYIKHILDSLMVDEYITDDGHTLAPKNIYGYLSRVMYARRSKFNPLWNSFVVGGFKDGEKFLGFVDLRGTTHSASTIATGYGAYLAQPILRKAVEGREDSLTEEEAKKIMNDCMRVLFYRDARSLNKIQLTVVNSAGVKISEPYSLDTEWSFAEGIRGYGA
ncbi:nucleophile aminohydrolase [Paraphysoderma sedebokerense]|nr:nucleophile aminohydrolase [Paraphysoderma sedebokerense]